MKYAGDFSEWYALSKKAQEATQPQDLYDINLKSAPSVLNL